MPDIRPFPSNRGRGGARGGRIRERPERGHSVVRSSYLFLALLLLAGCRTPYIAYDCEPTGAPWPFPGWSCDGGYSELALAPDTYQVSFSGKNISTAKSQDYALLRAAELALEKGQRYFLVLNSWGQTDVQLQGSPDQTVYHEGGFSTSTGGGIYNVNLPQATYVIQIIGTGEGHKRAYDALMIQRSVRNKYRLPAAVDVASGS